MKLRLFVREGYAVYPKSWAAYVLLAAAIGFLLYAFYDINAHQHSASDVIRNCIFMTVIVGVCVYLIALVTSEKRG